MEGLIVGTTARVLAHRWPPNWHQDLETHLRYTLVRTTYSGSPIPHRAAVKVILARLSFPLERRPLCFALCWVLPFIEDPHDELLAPCGVELYAHLKTVTKHVPHVIMGYVRIDLQDLCQAFIHGYGTSDFRLRCYWDPMLSPLCAALGILLRLSLCEKSHKLVSQGAPLPESRLEGLRWHVCHRSNRSWTRDLHNFIVAVVVAVNFDNFTRLGKDRRSGGSHGDRAGWMHE